MKTAPFAMLYLISLLGISTMMAAQAAAAPFSVSIDGQEVTDQKTGLIWRRCAEGMNWNGTTCAGTALTFTHEAALMRARDQAVSTGIAWRLPNVKELVSIVDRRRSSPAIDPAAFPATPLVAFWSASPYVVLSGNAWNVSFNDGHVGDGYVGRFVSSHVRLVRAAP